MGVGHHSLGPVDKHQAGTAFGPDQPVHPPANQRDLVDQRGEILLIGGQLHQGLSHLAHIRAAAGTQLIQLAQKLTQWAGKAPVLTWSTLTRYRPA